MRTLTQVASLAALAAHANAVCANKGTFDCTTFALTDTVQAAVMTYAGDYTWTMCETTTGYLNKMIQFTGDAAGANIVDSNGDDIQGTKGPVLFVHSATKDCLSWLTETQDENTDSIPKMLFDQGYDVFLACRRGTAYSRAHETFDLTSEQGLEDYFDYNTMTVGVEDIEPLVDLILANNGLCDKVQVLTNGLGAGEVLAGLASNATLPDKISYVTNLAPCVIPTYIISGDDEDSSGSRRLSVLTEKQSLLEPPRELQEVMDEEMPKRELSSNWYYQRQSYWNRIKTYCQYNPSSCLNYCDWYPDYCEEFCQELPEFCVPEPIRLYYSRLDLFESLNIVSLYGANWSTQVSALCQTVSYAKCAQLKATVDAGLAEMSVTQLEHMFQMDFKNSFSQYSGTFEADQTVTAIDVSGVNTRNRSIYLKGDSTCDTEINQAVLDTVPGQQLKNTIIDSNLKHSTLQGANNNADLLLNLLAALEEGEIDDAGSPICA